MTSELTNSSTASHSLTFGSRTKELCSFCKERPFDLVCQCGDKFDFNCIGQHVEALNFEYHDLHVAAGKELSKVEAAKRNVHSDAHRGTIDDWVRLRTQDIHDIAEAAKNGFKSNEQVGTEADELADMYKNLHEIQEQSVHDRLTFIVELNQRMKDIQTKLQTASSPTAGHGQLDESLRAKLSAPSSAAASGDSHNSANSLEKVSSRAETVAAPESPRTNVYRPFGERPAAAAAATESSEHPLLNGFGRYDPPTPEPARVPSSPTEMTFVPSTRPSPPSFERPSAAPTARVETPSPAPPAKAEVPSPSPFDYVEPHAASTRVELPPPAATRVSFDAIPPVVREELPTPPTVNPPVEVPKATQVPEPPTTTHVPDPPKPAAKPEFPLPEPVESGTSDEFDAGLSGHISRRLFKNIPAKNDQNAGTLCSHDDQLIYVDFDDTTKKSQVVFLHNVQQPDEKLIMDWIPASETGSSGSNSNEDWIRDITYCSRLDTYMLITQTCIHTWNDRDDRFKEYHRLVGRQLKRITTDQHFMYLISASGRMTARGDTIIFLSYDKDEVAKAFTDIIPSRMNRGTAPLNGEITDIAVATRDQLMITYRIERRSEVGICLFTVTNRGRDWSCVKQLQLNECWHNSLTYTPRVEWSSKLNVFVLIEYMTGHLLMIGQDGHVQGECRFTHNEGKSESPINLTISNRDWLCTRYDSMIVVKKLE